MTVYGHPPLWGDCVTCGSRRELELVNDEPRMTAHQRLDPLNHVVPCSGSFKMPVESSISSYAQETSG